MSDTTTVTRTGNFITLVFAGIGADFLFSTDTTANPGLRLPRIKIISIMWKGDDADDRLLIREGSSIGAIIFSDITNSIKSAITQYYGGKRGVRMNPCITVSQCSDLGNGTVTFEIA